MRIGIDIRELEKGKFTGIGRYLRNFLSFTAEFDIENEYILFGNQRTDYNLKIAHQRVEIIPEKLTLFWDQVKLPYHLRKEKIDIFLTPYFKAPLYKTTKLVVIINDLIPLAAPQYQRLRYCLKRVYFKSLIKRTVKKADKIITISQYSKKDIIKFLGVEEGKIGVITLSVSKNYYPITSGLKETLAKYGIKDKFIFYFGNFNPHKNLRSLLEAYKILPEEIRNSYKLVIGGKKNKYYRNFFKLIQDLDIKERVIFTDFIPEEDLPCLYRAAEVFVFPSFYEGFGLPLLEAMACGTPVIASNTSSLPEVVGDAAILIEPGNVSELSKAIEKVITDENIRKDLVNKGLNRVKSFSVEKTAGEILEILSKVG